MRKYYFFALFLVLYELAAYLANDMIMPGMLEVVREFHATQDYVGLSLSYYMLGNAALLLIAGAMAERIGKRFVMLSGNLIFLLFTILLLFSQNIHQFMLWRFFEGCGLAVIALGYGIIHENFNDEDSVKLISLMGNVALLAPLLGPVLGSVMMSYLSWRYIFIFTALIGVVSLIGLTLFTPGASKKNLHSVNVRSLCQHYVEILQDRQFLEGTFSIVLAAMPILFWIGQATDLILSTLHQNYQHFVIYQLMSISGISIASLVMQKVTGKYSISGIVKSGAILMLGGLLFSFLGFHSMYIIAAGFFIYTFGLGFLNGCIFRLVMSNKKFASSMVSSMFMFLQTLFFSLVGIVENAIAHRFHYSLLSFTAMSLIFGVAGFLLIFKYIAFYRERGWE